MSVIVPWQRLLAATGSHYLNVARKCRQVPLETLFRIHLLQYFFNHSDPAMDETMYEVAPYCRFVGIDLAVDAVPDETTICKFRHLLECPQLANAFLAEIDAELNARGLLLKKGIVSHRQAPVPIHQGALSGLFKNCQALTTKIALAHLYVVRRSLLSSMG